MTANIISFDIIAQLLVTIKSWDCDPELFLKLSALQGQEGGFGKSCWFFLTYFLFFYVSNSYESIVMTILFSVYSTLLENDSNSDVRRAVLSCIAPSRKTLPIIVGRTMDVKETVRKLAYEVNWITYY